MDPVAELFSKPVLYRIAVTNVASEAHFELPMEFVKKFHNQLGTVWTVHSLDGGVSRMNYRENPGGRRGTVVGGWKEFRDEFRLADGQTIVFEYLGLSKFRVDNMNPEVVAENEIEFINENEHQMN